MNYLRLSIVLGLAAVTAACGQNTGAPEVKMDQTAAGEATMNGNMANMAMEPATAKKVIAKGHGTVTAIDKVAGTITLNHGPIAEAKWPAMTMTFKAAPAITSSALVGEKVDFDVTLLGQGGEVTAIQKQP